MAKGYEVNKERREAVAALGRSLVRRSGSRCEFCGTSGQQLTVTEVAPFPENPDAECAIFLCNDCHDGLTNGKLDPDRWRFLESVVWSDIAAVQVSAVRIGRRLANGGTEWAEELLSSLYLSPEIESWIGEDK
ncbi:MAG: phnA protein [Proteobacteria bacterium]|nr:phnA protein [Pseudomonadota bacterium]